MNVKVSWALVQDERIFKNVPRSIFHEDVFWVNDTVGYFDGIKPLSIWFGNFAHAFIIPLKILPKAFEIRTPF